MKIEESEHWTRMINEESSIQRTSVIGKYLFFSDDKYKLMVLGQKLLTDYDLPAFKVSNGKTKSVGFGHVLCVYSNNSSLRKELSKFASSDINYRYFKADAATRAGEYSAEYLDSQM